MGRSGSGQGLSPRHRHRPIDFLPWQTAPCRRPPQKTRRLIRKGPDRRNVDFTSAIQVVCQSVQSRSQLAQITTLLFSSAKAS